MPPSLRRSLASVGRCNFEGLPMEDNLAHRKSSFVVRCYHFPTIAG